MTVKAPARPSTSPGRTRERGERTCSPLACSPWLYDRPADGHPVLPQGPSFASKAGRSWRRANVAGVSGRLELRDETTEGPSRVRVRGSRRPPLHAGYLRNISRQTTAPGLRPWVARRPQLAGLPAVSSAPTRSPTGHRDILHELAKHKRFGVRHVPRPRTVADVVDYGAVPSICQ